jgi:hypothetical protein
MDIFIVKDELINCLCLGITPHIVDGFTSIYEDAVRLSKHNAKQQNKRFLLDIQNWPERIINNETKRIIEQFPTLRKVLKTINYINIKSLALIGRHNIVINDSYVAAHTPSVTIFIHNVYCYSAKEFFHDDTVMDGSLPGTRSRQYSIITSIIKQVLNECVPIDELLHNINDDTEETLSIQNHEEDDDNNDEQQEQDEQEQEELSKLLSETVITVNSMNETEDDITVMCDTSKQSKHSCNDVDIYLEPSMVENDENKSISTTTKEKETSKKMVDLRKNKNKPKKNIKLSHK